MSSSANPDFGSRTDFYTFAPETLAQALPEFEIVAEVGKGSMGIVYEARQRTDGRRVALKVLPPSLTLTERALARFLREGEIMSKIEHPSIVRVFDLGRSERLHYFVMEFVEGLNLEERLRTGPLPIRQLAELGAAVARALHFAHERGVVHRDVKPGNLILRDDGTVAITDFGLARETGTGSMTESGAIVGTPMYMAPEQILADRGEVDSRADVYGLGATLHTLATGEPPFVGPTAQSVLKQVLDAPPPRPSRLRRDLPRDLENVLLHAMERRAEDRYGSALEFAEDLERFLAGQPIHARRPPPIVRLGRAARERPLLMSLLAVIVVLLLGAFTLYQESRMQRLEADLAAAEKTLAQATSQRDDQLRNLSATDRAALLEQAVAQATAVIEQKDDYARAWFVRAKANHMLGRYRDTLRDLDIAEQKLGHPTSELIHYRIDALSHLEDRESRTQLFDELGKLVASDPTPYNVYISSRHTLRLAAAMPEDDADRGALVDQVERLANALPPSDAGRWIIRARVQELRGNPENAAATIRSARNHFPEELLVHSEAAALFARLGLEDEGLDAARTARTIAPGYQMDSRPTPAVDVEEVRGFVEDLSTLLRSVEPQR